MEVSLQTGHVPYWQHYLRLQVNSIYAIPPPTQPAIKRGTPANAIPVIQRTTPATIINVEIPPAIIWQRLDFVIVQDAGSLAPPSTF